MTATILAWLCGSFVLTAKPDLPVQLPEHQRLVSLQEADTLVLCAPGLVPELTPWLRYRQQQGYQIALSTEAQDTGRVHATIRAAAASGRLKNVLLVGDDQKQTSKTEFHLPTPLVRAEVIKAWGPETELAADNRYADLDGDHSPDVALGRLPASDPDELRVMVDKILAYERAAPEGRWRRKINLVAGVGGFGMVADAVIETATRSFIRRGIPDGFETKIAYASWRSPYFPDPRRFRQHVVNQFNDGCLCWVYVGHGRRSELDWVRVPIGIAPILTVDDVERIECRTGFPIAIFLSCYGAAFDGEQDSLTERLLQHRGGPVAALGGSRVTMPYGMAVLSQALMDEMFQQQRATLGEVVMHAKRRTMASDVNRQHRLLSTVARAISPQPSDLVGERREHVDMFHLLGDPLLRLHHPEQVDVDVERSAVPGDRIRVQCRSKVAGKCLVELACRRGRFTFAPEARLEFDGSHEGMRRLDAVFAQANDDVYCRRLVTTKGQPFEVELDVPPHALGACTVRVYIEPTAPSDATRPSNTTRPTDAIRPADRRSSQVAGRLNYAIGAASLYVSKAVDSAP